MDHFGISSLDSPSVKKVPYFILYYFTIVTLCLTLHCMIFICYHNIDWTGRSVDLVFPVVDLML